MPKLTTWVAATCTVILLLPQAASAKTMWAGNLKGLKSFGIVVEEPSADIRDANCTQALISNLVAQKMQSAHVPISPDIVTPVLSVTVTGQRVTSTLSAYNISMEVLRTIQLDGNERTVIVWIDSCLVLASGGNQAMKSVDEMLDEFVGEWSRANSSP